MSDFAPLFAQTEQKYGLPPGILAATAQVESSNNPAAVSPKGAVGLMQLLPATAQSLKVDPRNPVQSIDAAGRLWQQNLKASGGDIDRAAMMYHGGTDPKNWGPLTQAYPGKLVAALGPRGTQQSDPVEAALSGGGHAQQGGDPVENALIGGNAARVPNGTLVSGAGGPGNQSGAAGGGGNDNGAGRNAGSDQQGTGPGGQGGPSGGLQPHQLGVIPGIIDAAETGFTAGLVHPVTAALNAVIPLDKLTNPNVQSMWETSLPDAFHHNLAIERGANADFREAHPYISIGTDLAGAVASPFNKLFAPAEGAGFLRSIPNFMAQGAAYGGTRGAAETGTVSGAAEGAAVGAAAGPVGAAVGNVAGKTIGTLLRARSTIANAIPQSERAAAAAMIDKGASTAQVVAEHPNLNPDYVESWVRYRANGGTKPVQFTNEAPASQPPSPQQYAAALGSQGERRGVEAVSDLPPQVQSDVQRLTQAGVAPQEAQREADILYVGGKPTVAAVTRDPGEQWAFNEGAKDASTDAGRALNDTQAANNQALHTTINQTVDNFGGIPAQGEAAQTAAEALANASDASRANVSNLYKQARAADGDVRVNTDQLRELLQSPEMQTPTNPAVKQLANGITAHLQAVDQRAGTTLRTPEEIEQIRQLANAAFDPMGGPVNGAVGKIGSALNDSLDQLDNASAAYKAARAAHRDWASQYSDPSGIARLIARDAQGNFLNADQWRLSENGLIDRLDDKPFTQVITQLKKIAAGGSGPRVVLAKSEGGNVSLRVEDPKTGHTLVSGLLKSDDGRSIKVESIVGVDGPNSFGPKIRQLLPYVREAFPNAEELTGQRVTGSRQEVIAALEKRFAAGELTRQQFLNEKVALNDFALRIPRGVGRNDTGPLAAQNALKRLKAGIVQRAYERSTNSARDKLGNPLVNGKLFQQELNKIGMAKLQALFSPDELAHLATVGRAARALNEPVPGTINTSNTSAAINQTQSSLGAALKAKPGSHPLLKALRATKYVSAGAGHLHAAVVLHGAEHLSAGGAERAVGQGVREQLNPGLARAAAARSQARIGNAQYRTAVGRALRNRGAVPAADNDRGKAIGRRLKGAL